MPSTHIHMCAVTVFQLKKAYPPDLCEVSGHAIACAFLRQRTHMLWQLFGMQSTCMRNHGRAKPVL
eukprot:7013460-Alexandrium_andersonii.AAC.1